MTNRANPLRSKVALALLPIALIAACGDDDAASDDPAADETTTTAADGPTDADLQGLLLTPEDLASDDALDAAWVAGDVSAGVDIQLPECLVEAPGDSASASAEAKLVTANDLKLPSVEQDLGAYADDAAAGEAFAEAAARLDGCAAEFTFQGQPAMGTIERLPLTLGGTESAAWRTNVTIAGAGVAITTVHVQDGDLEMALVHVDIGNPEAAVLEDLAATALAKLG